MQFPETVLEKNWINARTVVIYIYIYILLRFYAILCGKNVQASNWTLLQFYVEKIVLE